MDNLTFTRHTRDPLGPTWTLSGPDGEVEFGPVGIQVHSPAPMYGREEPNCRTHSHGCWTDGSSLAGEKLRKRWERAGCDDAVVRAEMEDWYGELLHKR